MNSYSAVIPKNWEFRIVVIVFSQGLSAYICKKIKKTVALKKVSAKLPFAAWEIDPNLNKNENFCGNFAQSLIYSLLAPEFSYDRKARYSSTDLKIKMYINELIEATHFRGIQPSD